MSFSMRNGRKNLALNEFNEKMSVVITMTTCRRFALFNLTLSSFLHYCPESASLPWIVIDDNSSAQDVAQMRALLPRGATLIAKNETNRGHDRSMNMLRDLTRQYDYVMHLEDDWEFLKPISIAKMVQLMEFEVSPFVGQLLVNENYREDVDEVGIVGSIASGASAGLFLHSWDPGHRLCKPGQRSNGHWPHYSLRPGLLRRQVWDQIGAFVEGHREFEREYAMRYMNYGYITAFLPGVSCRHLGKKSWETEQQNPSAYSLNGVGRF
jgi:GT2 family glycosyltransferase